MDSMIWTVIDAIAVISVHVLAVAATLFVVLYFRTDWNRNEGGRPLMVVAFGFAFFVDEVIIRFWFPLAETPWRRLLDLFTYLLILAGWIYLLAVLIRGQVRAARERRSKRQPNDPQPRSYLRQEWPRLALIVGIPLLLILVAIQLVRAGII